MTAGSAVTRRVTASRRSRHMAIGRRPQFVLTWLLEHPYGMTAGFFQTESSQRIRPKHQHLSWPSLRVHMFQLLQDPPGHRSILFNVGEEYQELIITGATLLSVHLIAGLPTLNLGIVVAELWFNGKMNYKTGWNWRVLKILKFTHNRYRVPISNKTPTGILQLSQNTKNNPFSQLFSWVWQPVLATVHLVMV